MNVDLLIRGGHIYDPGAGIDYNGDLAVRDKKIVDLVPDGEVHAKKELNAHGCWVVPGLIDVHTHCNWKGNYIGMPVDIAGIPMGVTATIDAGSTGVSNYRALLELLHSCETKTKILLHVSASGQIMSSQFSENVDPSVWNRELFERAFGDYPDRIVGLKIRVSKDVLKEWGERPLREAVRLAAHLHTRLFVHATNPLMSMEELTAYLRPGDVVCHMYHGAGDTILRDGKVKREIREARGRGVLFDISQGKGNFSLEVAREAVRQGFLPDTISTDLNIENWNNPLAFSLLMTMSKMMALGMTFQEVILAVTRNAAVHMKMEGQLGTLRPGTCADITLLDFQDRDIEFKDIYNRSICGKQIMKPLATIIDGQVLYRSPDTI